MSEQDSRRGDDGPVDPEDLAAARGMDPADPRAVARLADQLDTEGREVAVDEALSDERIRADDPARTRSTGWTEG